MRRLGSGVVILASASFTFAAGAPASLPTKIDSLAWMSGAKGTERRVRRLRTTGTRGLGRRDGER